ncbi:MAG: DNA repair protein RecN [Verrucomicrobiota bacterium]
MLTALSLRHLALVEELRWELGSGLVAVTGETGAGKSMIVGGLKLVLGERADKGSIRTGEKECTVQAIFQLPDASGVNALLEEAGLPPCEDGQLLVRRVISQSGNRQFLNDAATTLATLRSLGGRLIDLHGPHDHQSLFSPERQLEMLDAYARASRERAAYQRAYTTWKEAQEAYESLRQREAAGLAELELLRHQGSEIEAAQLQPGEDQEIEERYRRVSNASRLLEAAAQATGLLSEHDDSLLNQLAELQRLCRDLEKLDPQTAELCGGLEGAALELRELDSSLRHYAEGLELDPAEESRLAERLDLLEGLKRKYGPALDDVMARGQALSAKLSQMENREESLAEREATLRSARAALEDQAAILSAKRRAAAPRLAKDIAGHLSELGFLKADFAVALVRRSQPGPQGAEDSEFHFAPNPGEPAKPLRQVASSGEISRVMLAVKSALAEQDETPLLVFDEIDANVGGEIAKAVGQKMAHLAARHQVIAITHFPQVAAAAQSHFVVRKLLIQDRAASALEPIAGEARIEELARMLGGASETSRALAQSLLTEAAPPA